MDLKLEAIKRMKQLDIFHQYVSSYKTKDQLTLFEGIGGYYIDNDGKLANKVQDIEKTLGCKVYAITHEITSFGELYDFLYVSKYEQDWIYEFTKENDIAYVSAYVYNVNDDTCSELGTIGVKSFGGSIRRVY